MILIEITNLTKHRVDKKYFQRIGEIVLKKLKQPKNTEASLVFVGDAEMGKLNKKYRGINKTTDVLSFAYAGMKIPLNPPFSKGENLLPPFSKEGWGGFSGEVVISVPQARLQCLAKHGGQAKKQAKKRNYPLKRELTELFVHGILHLAGYDDETEKGYKGMIKKQKELLKFLAKN